MDTPDIQANIAEVHGPGRPWVYKRLVESDADFIGLIAYSLYKKRKTEIAESLRETGTPEETIDVKLQEYHDQVVIGKNEILRFRADATALLDLFSANASKEMDSRHEEAIKNINMAHARVVRGLNEAHEQAEKTTTAKHQKDLKAARKQAIDEVSQAAKQVKQKLGRVDSFCIWLKDGLQSTLAGALVTIFSFGLFALLTSDNVKIAIASKAVQVLTGTEPAKPAETSTSK